MAATFNCRDCGNVVSKRASACPKCGRPVARSVLGQLVSGVFKAGLIVVFLLGGLIFLVSWMAAGHRDAGAVAGPSGPATTGELGVLELPGGQGVWLATADADWDDLLAAEKTFARGWAGDGAPRTRMAEAGRARIYPNGTRVRIVKTSRPALFVEVTDGEDLGRSGWVQREFVRPAAAGR